ncbi:MAG TPA: hypothetical protein VKY89_24565 [Thermoanaerobaculia bacterium]|nr:hypothetical protein [Thermoanaerobaculia bacterium]
MLDAPTATLGAALIAALAGLGTAVYAGVTTRKSSRRLAELQAESTRRLAELQAQLAQQKDATLEYLRTYLNLEVENRNQTLAAFRELIRLTQLIREKLRRILAYPDAYAPNVAAEEVAAMATSVAECYAGSQINFEDAGSGSDRSVAHALKNDCSKAAELVERFLSQPGNAERDALAAQLAAITAKQDDLRRRARVRVTAIVDDMRRRFDGEGHPDAV